MAPLQKGAFYGLIFGIVWTIAIIAVFILKGGATAFDTDQTFRLIMDGIWIGGLIVYLVLFYPILRKPNLVDERDKLIYDRSRSYPIVDRPGACQDLKLESMQ